MAEFASFKLKYTAFMFKALDSCLGLSFSCICICILSLFLFNVDFRNEWLHRSFELRNLMSWLSLSIGCALLLRHVDVVSNRSTSTSCSGLIRGAEHLHSISRILLNLVALRSGRRWRIHLEATEGPYLLESSESFLSG